jgi:hypothetical protein
MHFNNTSYNSVTLKQHMLGSNAQDAKNITILKICYNGQGIYTEWLTMKYSKE